MRELEASFDKVVAEVNHLSTHDAKLAKAIRTTVKANGFGDFSVSWTSNQQQLRPLTAYEFIRAVAYIINPTDLEKVDNDHLDTSKSLKRAKEPLEVDWNRLRQIIFDPFLHLIEAKSKQRTQDIRNILHTLDVFIRDRQRKCAMMMLSTFRNPKVEAWKFRLERLDTFIAASDSGYHSAQVDDAQSVHSDRSFGSLGFSIDFLGEFISMFGDILLEMTGTWDWARYMQEGRSKDGMEQLLNLMLRRYTLALMESKYTWPPELDFKNTMKAIQIIRVSSNKISQYFKANLQEANSSLTSIDVRLGKLSEQLDLEERIDLLERPGKAELDQEAPEDVGNDLLDYEENGAIPYFAPIRDFLIRGEPFRQLIMSIRREFCYDDRIQLKRIATAVNLWSKGPLHEQSQAPPEHGLFQNASKHSSQSQLVAPIRKPTYRFQFTSDWKPLQFLRSQFGQNEHLPRLGQVVALSGLAPFAFAGTVSQYLENVWPDSKELCLHSLQVAIDSALAIPKDHSICDAGK